MQADVSNASPSSEQTAEFGLIIDLKLETPAFTFNLAAKNLPYQHLLIDAQLDYYAAQAQAFIRSMMFSFYCSLYSD